MADPAAWERVVDEHRLVVDEGATFFERLAPLGGWIDELLGDRALLDALSAPSEVILWVLVVSTAVAIGWLLYRWLTSRVQPRRRRPALEVLDAPPPDPRGSLDAALASGVPRAALAALVVWLATGLAERGRSRWSSELTNREIVLLARTMAPGWSGLEELAGLCRRVDVLLYGPDEPQMAEVRALLPRAEALLA